MFSTRVARASKQINWKAAVPRFFPNWAKPYQEKQNQLDALWREVSSAPASVEPMNWDYWAKNIQAPGVVAKIKSEYEAKKWDAVVPDVYQTEAQFKTAVAAAHKAAEFYIDYSEKLTSEIAVLEQRMRDFAFHAPDQFAYPGFKEEWELRLEDFHVMLSDEQYEGLDSIKPAEVSKQLAEGKLPEFPIKAWEAFKDGNPIHNTAYKHHKEFQDYAAQYGVKTRTLQEIAAAAKAKQAKEAAV